MGEFRPQSRSNGRHNVTTLAETLEFGCLGAIVRDVSSVIARENQLEDSQSTCSKRRC